MRTTIPFAACMVDKVGYHFSGMIANGDNNLIVCDNADGNGCIWNTSLLLQRNTDNGQQPVFLGVGTRSFIYIGNVLLKKIRGLLNLWSESQNRFYQGILHLPSSWASTAAFPQNRFHNKDIFSSYCLLSFVLIPGRGIAGVLFRALPDKLILYCTFVGLNRPFLVVFYKFRGKST